MTLSFSFTIPPLRIPGLGILGYEPLPKQKNVSADFLNVWGVFYANPANPDTSTKVFDVDSMISTHYDHVNKVSSFPVEKGSFVSYNKVNEPRTMKLKMVVHGGLRVAAFLQAVEDELVSINLYNIITPEHTYKNFTLEKVTYPREAKSVDLVAVDLTFLEVIEVASLSVQAQVIPSPKAAKATDDGDKKPVAEKPAHVPVKPWVIPKHVL